MTFDEIKMLLAMAAARDNRVPSQAMVMAWQYDLSDIAFDEAQEALNRHFRSPASIDEWLKPAHIRQLVKVIRDERRQGAAAPLALPSRFEQDVVRNQRIRAGVASCRDVLQSILRELECRRGNNEPAEVAPEEETRQRAIERARRERREWRR